MAAHVEAAERGPQPVNGGGAKTSNSILIVAAIAKATPHGALNRHQMLAT